MAEEIMERITPDYKEGDKKNYQFGILFSHFLNRAYEDLEKNGYPEEDTINFSDSSLLMHNYFYKLFTLNINSYVKEKIFSDNVNFLKKADELNKKAMTSQNPEEVFNSLLALNEIFHKVNILSRENEKKLNGKEDKLDNISSIGEDSYGSTCISYSERGHDLYYDLFKDLDIGLALPWNNIVNTAKNLPEELKEKHPDYKKTLCSFLNLNNIIDYRVKNGLPYISISISGGPSYKFKVDDDGIITAKDFDSNTLYYLNNTANVEAKYNYIKQKAETLKEDFESIVPKILNPRPEELAYNPKERTFLVNFKDFTFVFNYFSVKKGSDEKPWEKKKSQKSVKDYFPPNYDKGSELESIQYDFLYFENPIFKKHFQDDFKDTLIKAQIKDREAMFDIMFRVLKKAESIIVERDKKAAQVESKYRHINKNLAKQKISTEEKRKKIFAGLNKSEVDKIVRKKYKDLGASEAEQIEKRLRDIEKEADKVSDLSRKELAVENSAASEARYVVGMFFSSLRQQNQDWDASDEIHFNSEEKKVIYDYITKDSNGVFLKKLYSHEYLKVLDSQNIMKEQIERAINRDYAWTDEIKSFTLNHHYRKKSTKKQINILEGFDLEKRNYHDDNNTFKYKAFLYILDSIHLAENESYMNFKNLNIAVNLVDAYYNNFMRANDTLQETAINNRLNLFIKTNFIPALRNTLQNDENFDLTVKEDLENLTELENLKSSLWEMFAKYTLYNTEIKENPYLKYKDKLDDLDNQEWQRRRKDKNAKRNIPLVKNAKQNSDNYENKGYNLIPELANCIKDITSRQVKIMTKSFDKALEIDNPKERIEAILEANRTTSRINIKPSSKAQPKSNGAIFKKYTNDATKHILRKAGVYKNIHKHLQDPDFWPKDAGDHIDCFLDVKNSKIEFDIKLEEKVLNDIIDKLEKSPNTKTKRQNIWKLLDRKAISRFPKTRERIYDLYSDYILDRIGKDDKSERYKKRISLYIDSLSVNRDGETKFFTLHEDLQGSMPIAFKEQLLRKIADKISSQKEISYLIKNKAIINTSPDRLMELHFYGMGMEKITEAIDKDPKIADKFLIFLTSEGSIDDCKSLAKTFKNYFKEKSINAYSTDVTSYGSNAINFISSPDNMTTIYQNFWSMPMKLRAIAVARVLKSIGHEEKTPEKSKKKNKKKAKQKAKKIQNKKDPWEFAFDKVIEKIISKDDTSKEANFARDVMHCYIKSLKGYERELTLAAIMTADRNLGEKDETAIGKALRFFLEARGPAEIKLGQAIHSHPRTPEKIRKELAGLKSSAEVPTRWELFELMELYGIPKELYENDFVGDVAGAGSYFISTPISKEMLRILKKHARERAKLGFEVLTDAHKHLAELKKYTGANEALHEMIIQAQKMSKIETDNDIGEKQVNIARKIYDGKKIKIAGEEFNFKVCKWNKKSENWVFMDTAKGILYNDLENNPYKQKIAVAYSVFEIQNILKGNCFDHDRHGAQMCIDPETNTIGLFDFGAMRLTKPTPEEQRTLGTLLSDIIIESTPEKLKELPNKISDKIRELHKSGKDTTYLVEVQKGMLALGDYFNILEKKHIIQIVDTILKSDISKHIKAGISDELSFMDKIKFLSKKVTKKAVVKEYTNKNTSEEAHVECQEIETSTQEDRSKWFKEIVLENKKKEKNKVESPLCS